MKLILSLTIFMLFGSREVIAQTQGSINISGPFYGPNCLEYGFGIRPGTTSGGSAEALTSVTWNFGDGSTVTINPYQGTAHSYTTSGTYTVTAIVTSMTNTYTLTTTLNAIGNTNAAGSGFTVSGTAPTYSFTYTGIGFDATYQVGHSYTIDFGDGTSQSGTALTNSGPIANHTYNQPGSYTVTLTHIFRQRGIPQIYCTWTSSIVLVVPEDPCCTSFSPEPGVEYWLSAWVQEDVTAPVISYSNKACIELEFVISGGNQLFRLEPSGDIIEGWQRIAGTFTMPANTTSLKINMINENNSIEAYFDDIRIYPFNGTMKSYVYDPETLLLTAELDDNNYATFYEYDKEGQLIRRKKETERGVMTIEESHLSNKKKD